MRNLICIVLGLIVATSTLAADFSLTSSAFRNNERIPILYTCKGKNISPPLSWNNVPAQTKSFALVFNTPDWSIPAYLWIIYNIPTDITSLQEGASLNLPEEILVRANYFDEQEYRGPCPSDSDLHHYIFTLYALDTMLGVIKDSIEPEEFLDIIKPHILKQTELMGLFSH